MTRLVFVVLFVPFILAAQPDPRKEAIMKTARQFSESFMKGDIDDMMDCYTTDAVIFPNGMNIIDNLDSIRTYWTLRPGQQITHHESIPVEITIVGTTAYDYGNYEVRGLRDGTPWGPMKGKYVIVWREEEDGRWRMKLDIWNANPR